MYVVHAADDWIHMSIRYGSYAPAIQSSDEKNLLMPRVYVVLRM